MNTDNGIFNKQNLIIGKYISHIVYENTDHTLNNDYTCIFLITLYYKATFVD